jgi:uncharacterized membrane protein
MPTDLSKAFEQTPTGYRAMCWALYLASAAIGLATLGEFSGTLLALGCVVVILLARSRKTPASATIYGSHFAKIARVMTVSLVIALALLFITIITFGIGVIITWPLYLVFLIWLTIVLVRGMLKLNDGQPV